MNNFTHRYELLNDSNRGKGENERCLSESWKDLGLQTMIIRTYNTILLLPGLHFKIKN